MKEKKDPDVTIITPVFDSDDSFLKKIANKIKMQDYNGKVYHIFINDNPKRKRKIFGLNIINNKKNLGLAPTLKKGFKLAKTRIIISLMDDCLPSSNDWLKKIVEPLKDREVAATSSKVELPKKFWEKFDYFAKALTEKEQRVIIPGLDEKGCAYKKDILKKYGYFDTKNFKNGGEDTDLTIKLSEKWKIVNSDAKVYHLHKTNIRKRIKKEIQYAIIGGLVSRKHFFKLPWNFKIHVSVRIILFLSLLFFLFYDLKYSLINLFIIFLISNFRFISQFKKLGKDIRIILVPFLNLYIYFLYVFFFLEALIFKIKV